MERDVLARNLEVKDRSMSWSYIALFFLVNFEAMSYVLARPTDTEIKVFSKYYLLSMNSFVNTKILYITLDSNIRTELVSLVLSIYVDTTVCSTIY